MTDLDRSLDEPDGGQPALLSPAGESRRKEMLSRLKTAVVHRRRLRVAARWAAGAGAAAAIALGCLFLGGLHPRSGPGGPGSDPSPGGSPAPKESRIRIDLVHDDPGVIERYAKASVKLDRSVLIDDRELLELLQAVGRPSGLVRVGGEVILTSSFSAPAGWPADPHRDRN